MSLVTKLSLSLFSILILLSIPNLSVSAEKIIIGKAQVIDGDTIKINGKKIRLFGIDAPEKNQICSKKSNSYNCGLTSKKFLKEIIKNEKIECTYKNLDRYGRIIGKCISHTKIENSNETVPFDINYQMVRNGRAVEYKRYSKGEYSEAEESAKKEKRGIWKGKFDRPEKWRRKYK